MALTHRIGGSIRTILFIRTGPDECLYLQMLLEHLEEELDFPAVLVDSADGGRAKAKVVGQKFNFTLVIFITERLQIGFEEIR